MQRNPDQKRSEEELKALDERNKITKPKMTIREMRGQPASNGGLFGNTVAAPNYTGLFGNAYNFNAAAPTRGRNTNNRGRNQVRGGTYTYRRRDDDYRPNRRWGRRYSEDSDYEGSEEEDSYEESEEEEEEDSDEYDSNDS